MEITEEFVRGNFIARKKGLAYFPYTGPFLAKLHF